MKEPISILNQACARAGIMNNFMGQYSEIMLRTQVSIVLKVFYRITKPLDLFRNA